MGGKEPDFKKGEYLELINGMKDAVFIHDLDGNFLEVNEEAIDRLGYTRDELLSLGPHDIDASKYSEKVKKRIQDIKENETLVFETVHMTKEDKEIPIEINSSLITYQGESAVLSVARDISDRKEMEEKLKLNDFSLNQASLEIFWITPEGKFVYSNEETRKRLGYSKEELKNMYVWDVDPNHGKEMREKRWQKMKEEKTMNFESEHITKDGKIYPVEITNHYIEFKGKEYEFAFAQDITDRKEAQEKRDFLQTLLRQDLGSKYQTVQGYLQLLKEESELTEEQREYLEKSLSAGEKADEILSLAKELEKIEGTKWTEKKGIPKNLDSAINAVSDLTEEKGVEIEKDYPEKISKVKGDYSINTLLTQLLVTRIRLGKCDKIRIDAKEKENEILLKFEDDGKKLPQGIQEIFTGEVYTGKTTGFGGVRYYILREIIKHNGGKIETKNSEIGGTELDIRLQKAQQSK